jgi:hypothetical protein
MSPAEIVLTAREGPGAGVEIEVGEELTLGREPGTADFVVDDAGISRRHARLWLEDGSLVVEDLGSSNGTYVNGERISGPTRLGADDVLQLGSTSLEVSGPGAATGVLPTGPPTAHAQAPPPPPPRAPEPPPPPPQQPQPAQPQPKGSSIASAWQAVAAVVLGPLSILLLVFASGALFYASLPCGILAIALGSAGKSRADQGGGSRSLAVTGQVFGIVGTILATLVIVVLIAVNTATDVASDNLSGLVDEIENEIQDEVDSRNP